MSVSRIGITRLSGLSALIACWILGPAMIAQTPAPAPLEVAPPPKSVQSGGKALIFKGIIPPKQVQDMFGHRISTSYLAIQVTVFNTSREMDLIINDVSVDYSARFDGLCPPPSMDHIAETGAPDLGIAADVKEIVKASGNSLTSEEARFIAMQRTAQKPRQDTSSARTTTETGDRNAHAGSCQASSQELSVLRGVAEKGQVADPRNVVYRILQGIGIVGGGLTGVAGLGPVLPKAVAAFNGPGLAAFTTVLPDLTVNQMNRLNDAAYAANSVVAKQRSKVLVVFLPLSLFLSKSAASKFRDDPIAAFEGDPGKFGLKDLRVRVAYDFILPTGDIPPIVTAVSLADVEVQNLLDKKPAHGSIIGRFLDGATLAVSTDGLTAELDSARKSDDNRIYFVLTPSKALHPSAIEFVISKSKDIAKITKPFAVPVPAPTLTEVAPKEGKAGEDVAVTLSGMGFYDLNPSIKVTRGGVAESTVSVSKLKVVSNESITATLSLKDAKDGTVSLTVVIGGVESGTKEFKINPK